VKLTQSCGEDQDELNAVSFIILQEARREAIGIS